MKLISIILARGGSKGIPNKNLIDFCGKPLIQWTIDACKIFGIDSIWVSSDSKDILNISKKLGAKAIKRPESFSSDEATSEIAWEHAIQEIEKKNIDFDWILAPQVTSPFTEKEDLKNAIRKIKSSQYDSLFSCSPVDDLLIWQYSNSELKPLNYNSNKRKRRQENEKQFIENGAFYIFKKTLFLENKNRFSGRVGVVEMDKWKFHEIDEPGDLPVCSALMKNLILKK